MGRLRLDVQSQDVRPGLWKTRRLAEFSLLSASPILLVVNVLISVVFPLVLEDVPMGGGAVGPEGNTTETVPPFPKELVWESRIDNFGRLFPLMILGAFLIPGIGLPWLQAIALVTAGVAWRITAPARLGIRIPGIYLLAAMTAALGAPKWSTWGD